MATVSSGVATTVVLDEVEVESLRRLLAGLSAAEVLPHELVRLLRGLRVPAKESTSDRTG